MTDHMCRLLAMLQVFNVDIADSTSLTFRPRERRITIKGKPEMKEI